MLALRGIVGGFWLVIPLPSEVVFKGLTQDLDKESHLPLPTLRYRAKLRRVSPNTGINEGMMTFLRFLWGLTRFNLGLIGLYAGLCLARAHVTGTVLPAQGLGPCTAHPTTGHRDCSGLTPSGQRFDSMNGRDCQPHPG